MSLLLKLGWRNIGRNKRRSLLTIFAIMFAAFLTVAQKGLTTGTWEYNIKNTVELFSGYLQIQRVGYQANPSLNKSFSYPGEIEALLKNEPAINGYAPRILADGLISHKDNSSGAAIFGVDPIAERNITRFQQRVKDGKFFERGSNNEIVLGYKLLENLKAHVGDTLVILAQGFDGVMGNLKFRICGTVKLGITEFDAMTVFMDLRAAQELLAMEGRVNVVALSVPNVNAIGSARESISRALQQSKFSNIAVLAWDEVIPELKEAREFDSIGDWFFFGILVLIAAFGILNTVLMSVTERFREFGISLAIGMPSKDLVILVFLETLFISFIGILLGSSLGYAVNMYIMHNPIVLSGEYEKFYEDYGFMPLLIASDSIVLVLKISGLIFLLSCLACLYPAYRVSKLEPLKGIRYT